VFAASQLCRIHWVRSNQIMKKKCDWLNQELVDEKVDTILERDTCKISKI